MRTLFKPFALAAAFALVLAGCSTTTSPTGRTQYVGAVSQEQLAQLGARAFAEEQSKQPLSSNARHNGYVRCVVDALVQQLPPQWQQLPWERAVFVNRAPNAFALPGGKVGIYTGIFDVARNQDELAGVIAHEVGHMVANHHDERITRQYGAQFALQLASVAAGMRYGQAGADIVGQLGAAGLMGLFVLPGTRAQELEADIVGQQLMAQAGFDPHGAIALWQNMIQAGGGSRGPQWMSTHPDPQSRLAEMAARADALMPEYRRALAAGRRPRCG